MATSYEFDARTNQAIKALQTIFGVRTNRAAITHAVRLVEAMSEYVDLTQRHLMVAGKDGTLIRILLSV